MDGDKWRSWISRQALRRSEVSSTSLEKNRGHAQGRHAGPSRTGHKDQTSSLAYRTPMCLGHGLEELDAFACRLVMRS
jgi:hypothetical protein